MTCKQQSGKLCTSMSEDIAAMAIYTVTEEILKVMC
jgi:hypothetical protein